MLKLDIDPKPKIQYLDVTTRRMVATNFMGDYPSVFKGRGIAFESYREYTASEDATLIDWKASARCNKLLVKEFTEERNLDVFFLMDTSYTMVFGSQAKLKHEYAAEMIASMSFAILDRGDSVGIGLFSDTMHTIMPPEHGHRQYRRLLHVLTDPRNYDGKCNFEEAIRACLQRLKQNTVLILVTDAVGLEGRWETLLKVANQKFEVLAILVRDPRDDELPEGVGHVIVEDPETGGQILFDCGAIREKYRKAAAEIKERNLAVLKHGRIADIEVISTGEDYTKHIVKFFERRKRRWR